MTPTRIPRQLAGLRERRRDLDPEAGQAVSEILMWTAVIVVVIVALGAALEVIGVEVIDKVRSGIGL